MGGLKKADKNIDHRRVLNIATYLKRKGFEVRDDKFLPGDIVTKKSTSHRRDLR